MITGITGQDGHYLAEFLHLKGYEVCGLARRNSGRAHTVREELPFVTLVEGDLEDLALLIAALELSQPDEVYNLAGVSFVPSSYSQPELTVNINAGGVLRLLEAIRLVGGEANPIRFYQASSSEMFGGVDESPQDESTPFRPRNPYASSKVLGYHLMANYREAYGMYAASGILYNHESPRRNVEFVTRKVTNAAARIRLGLQSKLVVGDLSARRDWGYAGDYVQAMWLMLQREEPVDYVVATGRTHSVGDLIRLAFSSADIDDWEPYVEIDPRYSRPRETTQLVGNPKKANRELGWVPSVEFEELIGMMVAHDLKCEEDALRGPGAQR